MPLVSGPLSRAQTLNLLRCGIDTLFRCNRVHALPPVVQIEPTNTCNLRCELCAAGSNSMQRPAGFMSDAVFDRIVDELGDTLIGAVLYSWGEPLLHRGLVDMVRTLSRRGIATVTSTNGNAMEGPADALALVDAGLQGLVVALDGVTQESYGAYRLGGEVERVKQCLRWMLEARRQRQSRRPYINVRMVVNRYNERDIDAVQSLARECGADMFSFKSLGDLSESRILERYQTGPGTDALVGVPRLGRRRGGRVRCPFPFRQPTVFQDGTVVACEFDYNEECALGSLTASPFRELWNSDTAIAIRRALRKRDREFPAFCRRCPFPDARRGDCVLYARAFGR